MTMYFNSPEGCHSYKLVVAGEKDFRATDMRNRLLLIGLAVAFWFCIKVVDYLLPGPAILVLLCALIAVMVTHSLWLFTAQSRWIRNRRRRLPDAGRRFISMDAERWQPSVDIFVAAKNESRVIETCVRNLFKLDYPKFLVWIIDDCSTDATPEILEALKKEYPRLRVIRRSPGGRPGKSAALNEALPLSKGEVIAVFDADAYVAPNFLRTVLPVLAAEGVGAVQVQKRIYEYQKGFLVNCQASEYALDTYFQMGRDLIGGAVELRGNGQLIKRTALIDVGGWNNKAITDDLDLTMRLLINDWDIRFCPLAYVWEEGVTTLGALMRQRKRWAEGSIRRYLDYIFPLNSPGRLSLVERLDTMAFTTYFVVPALIFLEVFSEAFNAISGRPTNCSFFCVVTTAIIIISQLNFFIAMRLYRKRMPAWRAFLHTFEVNAYVFAHWMPCVFASLSQIMFKRQASTWHRTEHVGQPAPQLVERSS
ncbi:MAG TPA: glycosyltransferase family 2 protein [Candidatus Obscuribacterales bacterium]